MSGLMAGALKGCFGQLSWTHVVDFRCRGAAALPLQDGTFLAPTTTGFRRPVARTWRMFCDCLGHHQRDQRWSREKQFPEVTS
eukprot:s983_g8.t1